MDHVAVHVSQPEIAALVSIGQSRVIETEQLQNRRLQIVNLDRIVDSIESEFIRSAMHMTVLEPAARHPDAE